MRRELYVKLQNTKYSTYNAGLAFDLQAVDGASYSKPKLA